MEKAGNGEDDFDKECIDLSYCRSAMSNISTESTLLGYKF